MYCYCYYATHALFKSNKQYPYLICYVMYCDVCVVSVLVQSGVAIEPWMDGNSRLCRHCTSGGIENLHPSNGSYWFGMEFGDPKGKQCVDCHCDLEGKHHVFDPGEYRCEEHYMQRVPFVFNMLSEKLNILSEPGFETIYPDGNSRWNTHC